MNFKDVLPTGLPSIIPSVPQEDLQLPSLQQLDLSRKRKTNVGGLPSLGPAGGYRGNKKEKGIRGKQHTFGNNLLWHSRRDSTSSRHDNKTTTAAAAGTAAATTGGAAGTTTTACTGKGGLQELLQIVQTIERECLIGADKERETEEEKDPFYKCMDVILQVLDETKELIEQRKQILQTEGRQNTQYYNNITNNIK
ncbi:hypothetical protein, conserved [Eimeria praecox]|uniref:Uncharacterized protein n=1 Tax=Eimeria praecox TaxID=51316 RepID=U6G554_9EIME|nr:hypothetical protein, conserved [Eimeria praecox]